MPEVLISAKLTIANSIEAVLSRRMQTTQRGLEIESTISSARRPRANRKKAKINQVAKLRYAVVPLGALIQIIDCISACELIEGIVNGEV